MMTGLSSLSSIMKETTDSLGSPQSSSLRPEIPFGMLKMLVATRIDEFRLEFGRAPQYVAMSPDLWDRFRAEIGIYERNHGSWPRYNEWTIWGVQGMVIADFGDEIICADKS